MSTQQGGKKNNKKNKGNKKNKHGKVEEKKEEKERVITDDMYAILMETSEENYESWYTFIRVKGNEKNLRLLNKQLNEVDWHIVDGISTFDLEMDYLVSAKTAKEMTKVDLNPTFFHRKFDGVLEKITFGFKKKDSNERKMERVYDVLGDGAIADFIDDEDIDEEDLVTDSEDSDSDGSVMDFDSDEEDKGDKGEKGDKSKKETNLPPSICKIP